jgi:DNA-directed RNA polymerase subunit M/transcription elongation factor TFIIS
MQNTSITLPTLSAPKYKDKIPSSGKSYEYRPYRVGEEKVLMLAQESDDPRAMTTAIVSIIETCTFGTVDASKLTLFDVEYIFIKLRCKSVGEVATVKIKCTECDNYEEVSINLDEVEVPMTDLNKKNRLVKLNDDVSVTLRPLRFVDLEKFNLGLRANDPAVGVLYVAASIDTVTSGDSIYNAEDVSAAELTKFVESMGRNDIVKFQEFMDAVPSISTWVEFTCSKCGHKNKILVKGLQSFFA